MTVNSYDSYYTEIIDKFNKYKQFRVGLKSRSESEWNSNGVKKTKFSDRLIEYINNEWVNIFDRDSSTLNIKDIVINDISGFNEQTEHLCEYVWENIIKQHIQTAQCGYSGDGNNDTMVLNEYYLNQLEIFVKGFDVKLSAYIYYYNKKKQYFISKYIVLTHLEQLYPIFTLINRNYYNIYSFDTTRLSFLKDLHESSIGFISSIRHTLHYGNLIKYNKTEHQYMNTMITTFLKTTNLISSNYSKFIGHVLTRLFYKDIALTITDYI